MRDLYTLMLENQHRIRVDKSGYVSIKSFDIKKLRSLNENAHLVYAHSLKRGINQTMSKLTFNDAKRILSQIKKNEWDSDVRREWNHEPQSGKVYQLTRNGVSLWVANGVGFLCLSDTKIINKFITIPMHLRLYLWFGGVGKYVKQEIKVFNKIDAERDYKYLYSKLLDDFNETKN